MKYLTVCQGALLALSLAVVSTSASAGGYSGGQTAGYGGQRDCYKCPPPRNYDTQEVVKQTKDVDHSRVIETQSVVPSKRLIETNHLIIRENETRNTGTVQHNHTIIEKELILTKRNVDTKNVNTVVNLVDTFPDSRITAVLVPSRPKVPVVQPEHLGRKPRWNVDAIGDMPDGNGVFGFIRIQACPHCARYFSV